MDGRIAAIKQALISNDLGNKVERNLTSGCKQKVFNWIQADTDSIFFPFLGVSAELQC